MRSGFSTCFIRVCSLNGFARSSRGIQPRGALALAFVGLLAPSTHAELLPIINPGFEQLNVTLRPGEQTNGAGGAPPGLPISTVNTRWQFPFQPNGNQPQTGVLVPGWRTMPGAVGSLAGVLNPSVTFSGQPWMTGYVGGYTAVAQAAHMQQTLDVQLAPATRYTLSFLAGIGITDSSYTPLIALLAAPDLATFATQSAPGVQLLARLITNPIVQPQFGVMIPFSFSYTTPEALPPELVGKYIAISFLGSDGIPRVVYDDFRLEAVPIPGAGTLAPLAITTLLTLPSRRRARGRNPGHPRRGASVPAV